MSLLRLSLVVHSLIQIRQALHLYVCLDVKVQRQCAYSEIAHFKQMGVTQTVIVVVCKIIAWPSGVFQSKIMSRAFNFSEKTMKNDKTSCSFLSSM